MVGAVGVVVVGVVVVVLVMAVVVGIVVVDVVRKTRAMAKPNTKRNWNHSRSETYF